MSEQIETEEPQSTSGKGPSSDIASTEGTERTGGDDETEPEASAPASKSSTPPRSAVAPASHLEGKRPGYLFLAVSALVFLAADLGTKAWAVQRLEPAAGHSTRLEVIKGIFNLDLAQNRGGAWGIFGDQPDYVRLPFFFLISAVAVVFVVSLFRRLEPRQVALKWALPLLLGGAAGNLIDRIRHQYVVDFMDVALSFIRVDPQGSMHFFAGEGAGRPWHWPTFNVADVWICIGVGLMAVDMFTPRKSVPVKEDSPVSKKEREAEPDEAEA